LETNLIGYFQCANTTPTPLQTRKNIESIKSSNYNNRIRALIINLKIAREIGKYNGEQFFAR
jgi:hypothetical protein